MERRPVDDFFRPRGPVLIASLAFSALLAVAVLGASGELRVLPEPALPAPPLAAALVAARNAPEAVRSRYSLVTSRIARNQTVSQALFALELGGEQVKSVLAAMTNIFPFHKARPGDQLAIEREEDGSIRRIVYRQGPADEWIVQPAPDGTLYGEKRVVELERETARVKVTIESSLYEALRDAGEDPGLAVAASEVLAWDVDFYQDVRAGDTMTVVVEKVYADGRLLRYGEVLAAEYTGSAVGRKRLFRYTDPTGQTSYFDDRGESARRGFLKSPLKYANLTSRFGNRRHPVLGYMKAHQGVDYGAPTGTPVWAVGDGTAITAGWSGGCGKTVILRHRNGLDTVYCHLSTLAVGVGARVSQKQVIGYVGATGIATGPHLHYAVKRAGTYVNPLGLQLPRDAPVAPQHLAHFREAIAPLRHQLDGEAVAQR